MKITVKTFANFRKSLGKEVQVDIPEGETIQVLLIELCKDRKSLQKDLFDNAGQVKPYLNILKNGIDIRTLEKMETRIKQGDIIAILPPFAGG
jgi:molybdopterin synthase sulfur carrier subunit